MVNNIHRFQIKYRSKCLLPWLESVSLKIHYLWLENLADMNDNNLITMDTLISRNETKFLANALGEELVMMNMENGDFISMNKVGADIWKLCETPITFSLLLQKLVNLYDIEQEKCIVETTQFFENGQELKMFLFTNN